MRCLESSGIDCCFGSEKEDNVFLVRTPSPFYTNVCSAIRENLTLCTALNGDGRFVLVVSREEPTVVVSYAPSATQPHRYLKSEPDMYRRSEQPEDRPPTTDSQPWTANVGRGPVRALLMHDIICICLPV